MLESAHPPRTSKPAGQLAASGALSVASILPELIITAIFAGPTARVPASRHGVPDLARRRRRKRIPRRDPRFGHPLLARLRDRRERSRTGCGVQPGGGGDLWLFAR